MNELTGTSRLIALILRRDRIILPIWIVVLAVIPFAIGSSFLSLYATDTAREAYASNILNNPAEVALIGPLFGPTLGGLAAWRLGVAGPVLLAVAAYLTVIRHTRSDEEAGRRELIGASSVGRGAPLAAALIVSLGACVLVAILSALSLIGLGYAPAGSLTLGAAAGLTGWAFAGVGAIAAQLSETASGAKKLASATLGAAYILRLIGDGTSREWLSWLSPIGWAQRTRPFADERPEVLLLLLGLAAVQVFFAYRITLRRDLGAGILRPAPGRGSAGQSLRGPFGLAWRLQSGSILSWSLGLGAFGLVFGYVIYAVAEQLLNSPQVMEALGSAVGGVDLADFFFTLFWAAFAIVASIYGIGAILRMRDEESSGKAELLLAAPIGRTRWAWSHITFALLGQAIVILALGVLAGLGFELSRGGLNGSGLGRVLLLSLAYLPASWAMIGVTTALFGVLPRLAVPFSWGWLGVVIFIDLGKEMRFLPDSIIALSPYSAVPKVLLGEVATTPLLLTTAVAAALITLGLFGLRRRDIG